MNFENILVGAKEFGGDIISALPYVVGIIVLIYLAKLVRDKCTEFDDNVELFDNDNPAVGIATAGYYFGFIPVMAGVLTGEGYVEWYFNALDFAVYGVLSIIFMNVTTVVVDKFILPNFKIEKELVKDKNKGTAWVMFGAYIATGWVVFGSIQGEPQALLDGVLNSFYFFGLGQLAFVAGGKFYQLFTSYDIHYLIEKDNASAGMAFGGYLAALGTIIGHSGDLQVAVDDTVVFLLWSIVGALALGLFARAIIAQMILIPGRDLVKEIEEDDNSNAGWMAIVAYQLLAWVFVLTIT